MVAFSFEQDNFSMFCFDDEIWIMVDKSINTYILERTWHKNQTCHQEKDGSVYLSFESNQLQETLFWVLHFGSAVKIMNPPELKQMYKEEIEKMSKNIYIIGEFSAPLFYFTGDIMSTVAAISTGLSPGGIGIVRISGENAVEIADKVFISRNGKLLKDLRGYSALLGSVKNEDGTPVDEVVALVFRAPKSYTGEDVVELNCHGGLFVTRQVLRSVLSKGALPAPAGEFTKRAIEKTVGDDDHKYGVKFEQVILDLKELLE